MFILDQCNDLGSLGTIYFIKNLVAAICIIAPILLLLMLTIDFVKATMAENDNKIKKLRGTAIKRIIYAIIIFFVPTIINGVMGLLDNSSIYSVCYELANKTNVERFIELSKTEQELRKAENEAKKEELRLKKEKIQKQIEENRKKVINTSDGAARGYVDGRYHQSSCKIGESGRGVNGVGMSEFYDDDWSYVARFKDPRKSNLAAQCINELTSRKNIHYDAEQYTSLWDEAALHNFDIFKIDKNKDLYTVCCPFVTVCAKYTGATGISERAKTYRCDQSLTGMRDSIADTGEYIMYEWGKTYNINGKKVTFNTCESLMQGDILISIWHEAMAY